MLKVEIPATSNLSTVAWSEIVILSVWRFPELTFKSPLIVTLSLKVERFPDDTMRFPSSEVVPLMVTLSLNVVSYPVATSKVPFIVSVLLTIFPEINAAEVELSESIVKIPS